MVVVVVFLFVKMCCYRICVCAFFGDERASAAEPLVPTMLTDEEGHEFWCVSGLSLRVPSR